MYYQIYVDNRKNTYTYESDEILEIGSFCEVDFANKKLVGVVIRETKEEEIGNFKIKKIERILNDIPNISQNLLDLVKFINIYYITDFYASMQLLGPIDLMSKERIKKLEDINTYIGSNVILNEDQERVYNEILNSKDKFFLLKGITGSGKTQIYIKLIEQALKKGKSSIFLVPEISLTNQMMESFKEVFGDNISIIHSKTTKSKKIKEWEKIYSGKTKIVIGARSALFAPLKNLEYIFIDEEHESTYKQEDNARYHVKNVAVKRAILEGAKVILGSATPSFDSYYLAKKGVFKLLELNKRYNNAKLPSIELVNLEEEPSMLSENLLLAIQDRLEKKEQVILLLNRKSHSLLVKCHDCGNKIKCPNCSINLHYYKKEDIMRCSYCDYKTKKFKNCSLCNSEKLEFLGLGIEKIEEELIEKFGSENILRMDGSKTSKEIKEIYKNFLNEKYPILIGTQILAKGFHFPNVTLVGVLNGDQLSQFIDFRAGEKAFQLITQAIGRAGRENKEGKVILQSFDVDSKLIDYIKNNDYEGFFEDEMQLRKILNLPPYSKMIKIISSSKNEELSKKMMDNIYFNLSKTFKEVSFPSRASIYLVDNRYRNVIYIKTSNEEIKKNRKLLLETKNLNNKSVRVIVDIDPINMV